MSVELRDVLSVCRQIRGNDHDSGTYYLLGYLWASISDKEKAQIAKIFNNDLKEMENK